MSTSSRGCDVPRRLAWDRGDGGWLAWWRSRGTTIQALVPGTYAWAVTALPFSRAPGASTVTVGAVGMGLVSLAVGPFLERRWPDAARIASGWGLVASSVVAWTLAPPAALATFDAARGIAGMSGWGLFALALASPARFPRVTFPPPVIILPASGATRIDTAVVSLGVAVAVSLQVPGWRVGPPERALLIRLISLAGGLASVTAGCVIAAARYRVPGEEPSDGGKRSMGNVGWVALVLVLLVVGSAFAASGGAV